MTAGLQEIRDRMAELETAVPVMLFDAMKDQLSRIRQLDDDLHGIDDVVGGAEASGLNTESFTSVQGRTGAVPLGIDFSQTVFMAS